MKIKKALFTVLTIVSLFVLLGEQAPDAAEAAYVTWKLVAAIVLVLSAKGLTKVIAQEQPQK